MMEVVNDPQLGSDPSIAKQPSTTEEGNVPTMDLERTLPRQISTGVQRGTQTIAGDQIVSVPDNGVPVISMSGTSQNQIFSDPNTQKPVIIVGKQDDKTFSQRIVDENGIPVAQFGQQTDGTINLKFFSSPDNKGNVIGLAQFGRFSDGTTALKIAQPGFEVATATGNQLSFDSTLRTMQIVDSGTLTMATTNLGTGLQTSLSVVANYLDTGQTPVVLAYIASTAFQGNLWTGTLMLGYTVGAGITISQMDILTSVITTTSTTFTATCNNGTGSPKVVGGYIIRYYVLKQNL